MSETMPASTQAAASGSGTFLAAGRAVNAGRGWGWIADGWQLFLRQPAGWIISGIVFLLVTVLLPTFPPVLGSIASALLTPALLGGLMMGADAVRAKDTLKFQHLFAAFHKHTGSVLSVGLIWLVSSAIITVAVVLVVGVTFVQTFIATLENGDLMQSATGLVSLIMGSFMTILLGLLVGLALLVPVAMMLWFAPALIVLNDMSVGAALKASFVGCLKNFIPFLVYGIVMLVLSFAAALPLMLGYLILIPVVIASIYTSYRDIYFLG